MSNSTQSKMQIIVGANTNITDTAEGEKILEEVYDFYFGPKSNRDISYNKMIEVGIISQKWSMITRNIK